MMDRVGLIIFDLTRMSDDEIEDANSGQPLSDAPHYVWQYLQYRCSEKRGQECPKVSVLATALILNFILITTQHVLRLCKTSSVCVTRCTEQEVRNKGKLSWIGAVHTKQRQVSFRTKQCGPMLQRCHQPERRGMRCT